jgi:hypothetical protein
VNAYLRLAGFRASLLADLRRAESRGNLRTALCLRAKIRDLSEPPAPVMPAMPIGPGSTTTPRHMPRRAPFFALRSAKEAA